MLPDLGPCEGPKVALGRHHVFRLTDLIGPPSENFEPSRSDAMIAARAELEITVVIELFRLPAPSAMTEHLLFPASFQVTGLRRVEVATEFGGDAVSPIVLFRPKFLELFHGSLASLFKCEVTPYVSS